MPIAITTGPPAGWNPTPREVALARELAPCPVCAGAGRTLNLDAMARDPALGRQYTPCRKCRGLGATQAAIRIVGDAFASLLDAAAELAAATPDSDMAATQVRRLAESFRAVPNSGDATGLTTGDDDDGDSRD